MSLQYLQQYFRENEIRIGEDFTLNTPAYYISLYEAFHHYFLTTRDVKDTLYFKLTSDEWKRETFTFQFTGNNENIVFSILHFHRFIEMFLKDILGQVNPFLKVKFPNKPEDIIAFHAGKMDVKQLNSIECNEAYERLKAIYNGEVNGYKQISDFSFIIENEYYETIKILTEWRNRLMHNGEKIINGLAFDYLVSQRLIPLIVRIVSNQTKLVDFKPHFYETHSGIKIIDEICKVNFHFNDFKATSKRKELIYKILKLAHLKELGRAAYNHDFMKRSNFDYYQFRYNNPTLRSERCARSESEAEYFYKLSKCTCCDANSMVIYKHEFDDQVVFKKVITSYWGKCFNCDYMIWHELGDPHIFNLSNEPFFA